MDANRPYSGNDNTIPDPNPNHPTPHPPPFPPLPALPQYICAGSISITQLGVAAYMASIGETNYALALLALLVPQVYFQLTLLFPDPIANDVKFQGASQPFFVFGILATALGIGHHTF